MGGCCGEPADKDQAQNRYNAAQYPATPIRQQPGAQPGLQWQEKNQYNPPSIPSPSPTHYPNGSPHSPPPQSQFNGYTPANSSTLYEQTINGHTFPASGHGSPPPLLRPNAVHAPGGPPPGLYNGIGGGSQITSVTPAGMHTGYAPPSDEGKLSVSIDFGGSRFSQCET